MRESRTAGGVPRLERAAALACTVVATLGCGLTCGAVAKVAQPAAPPEVVAREAPAAAAPEVRTPETSDADTAARLDRAIQRHSLGTYWGAALVIRNGVPLLAKGYGMADERLRPIDADTLFDVGSVAKMFTAAAVLKLHTRGVLSLDDPVARFFPDVPEIAQRVTLRHLIAHVSGLDDRFAMQPLNFENRDEAVRLAFDSKFKGEVGKEFLYSNAGYVVLAAIIEKASGRKFEDVVREEVFVRAGMTSTGFLDGVGLDEARQTARVIEGRGRPVRTTLFAGPVEPWAWGLRGAGGVVTCLSDLMKWRAAVLGENDAFTPEERREMFTPQAPAVDVPYGLGWFISTTQRGTPSWSHGGSTRGYLAEFRIYPEEGTCIAVLTNQSGKPRMIAELLAGEMFGTESPRAIVHAGALAFDENLVAKSDDVRVEVTRIDAAKQSDRRELAVTIIDAQGTTVATLELTRGAARGLVAGLEGWLKRRSPPDEGAGTRGRPGVAPNSGQRIVDKEAGSAVAGSSAVIGMSVYGNLTPDAQGAVTLPDDLTIDVRPEYRGLRPDGSTVVDPRITIVIVDDDRGFWPIILQLDDASAFTLAAELNASIAAKE